MRKYVYQRTCPRDIISNEHHQASSQFVGEILKGDISRVVYNRAHPKDVMALMALMCGKHKVEINYHVACKAWYIASDAFRGATEQSYPHNILALCAVLKEKNPSKTLVVF